MYEYIFTAFGELANYFFLDRWVIKFFKAVCLLRHQHTNMRVRPALRVSVQSNTNEGWYRRFCADVFMVYKVDYVLSEPWLLVDFFLWIIGGGYMTARYKLLQLRIHNVECYLLRPKESVLMDNRDWFFSGVDVFCCIWCLSGNTKLKEARVVELLKAPQFVVRVRILLSPVYVSWFLSSIP